MFQDGAIAQAADTVFAQGVPYFSSAGNNARQSFEASFKPSTFTGLSDGPLHDFDIGPEVDTKQSIIVPVGDKVTIALQWQDPFFSVSGAPGAATDLDIFITGSGAGSTTALVGSVEKNVGNDPVEIFLFENDGTIDVDGIPGPDTVFNIAIEKVAGPDPSLIKYAYFGTMTINEYDTASPSSYGHANAAGAESVAAAFFFETPAFGTNPPLLESFSSVGGVPILFDKQGKAINEVRQKPEITAPDGTNTTFFGQDIEQDDDAFPNFFGTSAAAPHAAAVAALLLERTETLTPSEVYKALESTAIDMASPGFDNESGFGLIQADKALQGSVQAGLTASLGAKTPATTVTASPGEEVAVLQLKLAASSNSDALSVSGFTLNSGLLSTAVSLSDVAAVNVYLDANDNGKADGSETLLGTAAFNASGTALVNFGTNTRSLSASGSETYVITYKIAATLSSGLVGLYLAFALAPFGLILLFRRRRGLTFGLLGFLLLAMVSCNGGTPTPQLEPRSFSSSLTGVSVVAQTAGVQVDLTGLPIQGSRVTINP
jgi:hypothetical protein